MATQVTDTPVTVVPVAELTFDRLEQFRGGELEIKSPLPSPPRFFHGPIKNIRLDDGGRLGDRVLVVELTWCAVTHDSLGAVERRWVVDRRSCFSVHLSAITAVVEKEGILVMNSLLSKSQEKHYVLEMAAFHRPGILTLNPARVVGLQVK